MSLLLPMHHYPLHYMKQVGETDKVRGYAFTYVIPTEIGKINWNMWPKWKLNEIIYKLS